MYKRGKFDYILLETTGLADPGNLAPLFWVDDGLGSTIYLDGIVTLVDARNILRCLDDPAGRVEGYGRDDAHQGPVMTTAHVQISHADVIVLNKSDLVEAEDLQLVRERIKAINGLARIHVTQHGAVPRLDGFLLHLHAYDKVEGLDVAGKSHSHLDPVSVDGEGSPAAGPRAGRLADEAQTISTISIPVPRLAARDVEKMEDWFRSVLWEGRLPGSETAPDKMVEIHRLKGRLVLDDGREKMVQGVRETFEILDHEDAGTGSSEPVSRGKLVLIGRHLSDVDCGASLMSALG